MKRKLAVLFVLFAVPLAAQVRETIEVAITSVDVVVTDAKGNRVRGLTRNDFELLEDGKPREITNFTEYASTAPAVQAAVTTVHGAVATPAVAPPPARRILIVFDSNTLSARQRRDGAAAMARFVERHVRPNDRVMVAVLSQMFTPRTEWITDPAQLKAAIEKVGSEVTAVGADSLRVAAQEEMQRLLDVAASTTASDALLEPPKFLELVTIGRRYAEQALIETRNTTSIMSKVVSQLAIYPEKKAVLFVGEGLEAKPGVEIFERLESIRSQKVPSVGAQVMLNAGDTGVSPMIEANRFNATAELKNLADLAYSKGVPIFAINSGTNSDPANESNDLPDVNQEFARFASKAEGYRMVGEGSGGAAYLGMKADVALDTIAGDLGGYYSLGFRATGKLSRASIQVRVKSAAKHRVRTALAVAPASPADAIMDAVVAHHVLDPENNDLEIELEADDPVAVGEKQKVKLNVIIPIRNLALQRQGNELTGGFDVYLSISDGKGYFSDVNKQSHAIRWNADDIDTGEQTMTYSIDVTLEKGASQISVGVVDQKSKRTGYEKIVI